jgi:hypothetical protein
VALVCAYPNVLLTDNHDATAAAFNCRWPGYRLKTTFGTLPPDPELALPGA